MAPAPSKPAVKVDLRILLESTRDTTHAHQQFQGLRKSTPEWAYVDYNRLSDHYWKLAVEHGESKIIPFCSYIAGGQFSNMQKDGGFYYWGRWFTCVEIAFCYTLAIRADLPLVAQDILACTDPKECKWKTADAVAKYAPGFKDSGRWHGSQNSRMVLRSILMCKYQQNPGLLNDLMDTGDAYLAEALSDKRWGCGVNKQSWAQYVGRRGFDPTNWEGTNWAGLTLMEVREYFRHLSRHLQGKHHGRIPVAQDSMGRSLHFRVVGAYRFPLRNGIPTPAPQADRVRIPMPSKEIIMAPPKEVPGLTWLERPPKDPRETPVWGPDSRKRPLTSCPAQIQAKRPTPPPSDTAPEGVQGTYGGLGTLVQTPIKIVPDQPMFPVALPASNPTPPEQCMAVVPYTAPGAVASSKDESVPFTFTSTKPKSPIRPPRRTRHDKHSKTRLARQSRKSNTRKHRHTEPQRTSKGIPSLFSIQAPEPEVTHQVTPVESIVIDPTPDLILECTDCGLVHSGPCQSRHVQALCVENSSELLHMNRQAHYLAVPQEVVLPPAGVGRLLCIQRRSPVTGRWEEQYPGRTWGPVRDLGILRYWMPLKIPGSMYAYRVDQGPPNAHLVDAALVEATKCVALMLPEATHLAERPEAEVLDKDRRVAHPKAESRSELFSRTTWMVNANIGADNPRFPYL